LEFSSSYENFIYFFYKIVIPPFLPPIFLAQICLHKIVVSCTIIIVGDFTVLNKPPIYIFMPWRVEILIIRHWITNESLHCIKGTEVII